MALAFLFSGRLGKASSAEALLAQFTRSGKPGYMAQLVEQCGPDLYYFLLKQSDAKMAEDVSQQTWLKVLEQHQRFAGGASFKTWLFTIGRHTLVDEMRRQQRWQTIEWDDHSSESADTEAWQKVALHQQQMAFDAHLAQLPFVQREALILQLEGFSLADIALITGQPQETIKSRLRYARQFLQQFCGVDHD